MQNQAFIKKRISWKAVKKESAGLGKGLFFLAPALLLMLVFTFYPLFNTVMLFVIVLLS